MSKIEFHYSPKHASWLNMVEIEIAVLRTMCLDRRIEQRCVLESEIATWERGRNANRERIQWMFDCEMAQKKCVTPTRRSTYGPMPSRLPLEPVIITLARY